MDNSSTPSPLVLVVEDDFEIANFLVAALGRAGYRTALAHDKDGALAQFAQTIPDLVILDVMLPGEDGFSILGRIRQRYDTPVIMLTARGEPSDRIKGLMGGADDYVTKPFHTGEVIARVETVLRRKPASGGADAQPTVEFDGWALDLRRRRLTDPEAAQVVLTSGEFDILAALCRHPGETLSRDRLVQIAQNRAVEPYDRSVDTLVSRVRRKLQARGGAKDMIKTVRNGGYVFTPEVREVAQ